MMRTYSYMLTGLVLVHFFAAGNYVLYAQASDNATLNVALSDVRSIMVNPTQNTVEIVFATAEDYQNGVVSTQSNHIMVTSTGGFQITVKASTEGLVNGAYSIPVNTIGIRSEPNARGSIPRHSLFEFEFILNTTSGYRKSGRLRSLFIRCCVPCERRRPIYWKTSRHLCGNYHLFNRTKLKR